MFQHPAEHFQHSVCSCEATLQQGKRPPKAAKWTVIFPVTGGRYKFGRLCRTIGRTSASFDHIIRVSRSLWFWPLFRWFHCKGLARLAKHAQLPLSGRLPESHHTQDKLHAMLRHAVCGAKDLLCVGGHDVTQFVHREGSHLVLLRNSH